MVVHWIANILCMLALGVAAYGIIAEICDRIQNAYLDYRFYKCRKCGHTYMVPTIWRWLIAPHLTYRLRYMKCPHCGKRNWMKCVK